MSPQADTATDVETFLSSRMNAADRVRPVTNAADKVALVTTAADGVKPMAVACLDTALDAVTLALANADRALRRQPLIESLDDLHADQRAVYHASGLATVIAQQPSARLEAINDAAEHLRGLVDAVITDPEAAIVNDPERMKDACTAWVRAVITIYREGLAMQLAILRSAEVQPAKP